MKHMTKATFSFLAIALTANFMTGCGKKEDHQHDTPIPVIVVPVLRGTFPETHRYAAELQPAQLAMLRFRGSGYVAALRMLVDPVTKKARPLDIGDSVPAGGVLASLRKVDFATEVDAARATTEQSRHSAQSTEDKLRQSEAQLVSDEASFRRAEKLYAAAAMTGQDYDKAKAQYESSLATRDSTRKQLDAGNDATRQSEDQEKSKRLDLSDSDLKAPFPGVVLGRNVNIGDFTGANSNQEAFRFGDIRFVKAVFAVPANAVSQLHLGDEVDVHLPQNSDLPVKGKVNLISTVADQQSRLFTVQVVVPNPGRKLLIGTTGSLELRTGVSVQETSVPFTSLVAANADTKGYTVFVLKQEGDHTVTKLRKVYLLSVAGDKASISGDIQPNEQVVDRPGEQLRDGSIVVAQKGGTL